MSLKSFAPSWLLVAGIGLPGWAFCIDPFHTEKEVPPGPAYPLYKSSDSDPCRARPLTTPLPLVEALEHSLCDSPKTRAAWASVKAAAAVLGEAKSAYLPALTLTGQYSRDHAKTTVDGPADLESNYQQNENSEALSLIWLLYDFGGRSATLKNSRELLLAAQQNQNVTLQAAFEGTARDYYSAQAAEAKVQSALRVEAGARTSLDAAQARYKTGVAPITDQLIANTAFAQAVYERAAAEGAYRTALGVLAVDMSLSPDAHLTMPSMDQGVQPDERFTRAVHDIIMEATETHPSVLAADAQYQAALANVSITKAQGMPKIQLQGTLSHSDQPLNANIGGLTYPSHSTSGSIGVGIQVPLFSGFGQSYKIREAQATADQQGEALRAAKQQVALGVWSGVQIIASTTENLKNTDTVVQSARAAFDASEQRYQAGVGNILELLNSQTSLAGAEQQKIQAQLDWRAARLALAASLGTLGLWDIK